MIPPASTGSRPSPLPRPDRRQVLFGGALFVALGAAAALYPRRERLDLASDALQHAIPPVIGPYRYLDRDRDKAGFVVPDQEQQADSYDELLTRIYVAGTLPPIMLLIAYGSAQNAGIALHRPEACYASAGYRIRDRDRVPIPGIAGQKASFMSASQGGRVEQIYTWMRIGDSFPASSTEEKIALIKSGLRGVMADGVLVRLSVRSRHRAAALAQIEAFNALMIDRLNQDGRHLLLGERTNR